MKNVLEKESFDVILFKKKYILKNILLQNCLKIKTITIVD